ncbi:fibroblast growth factor-binding protein 1-like [Anoplopoma fimbria]|uniref:fibroblast growth factor-binding protein 1-like n=1 Tax=Anoplopoma fimbria TaxID=229290 RepID=UPI0023EB08B9|nr:fibroblast growth factor-binding protein 1-like [Anoplopoma fimbria]
MFLLSTVAPWLLLLLFLGQQVSLSCGARSKNRGADKAVTSGPVRGQRSGNKLAVSNGKFSIRDTMQCTWGSREVRSTVRLSVKCEDRETRVQCVYNGKPQRCPGYQNNNKGYWKQVARALKRLQGNTCKDERVQVRAAMCKREPRTAHFKLDVSSSVGSAQSGEPEATKPPPPRSVSIAAPPAGPTACTVRADHRKTAEENCSGSWASVCNFFLSMLQSEDC